MIQKKTAVRYAEKLKGFIEEMRISCKKHGTCTKCEFCDVDDTGYCNQKYDNICNHFTLNKPLTLDAIIADLGGDDAKL